MSMEQEAGEGLVAQLGRFANRISYEQLPAEAREMAKGRVLDTLSCCLAGRHSPSSLIAISMAEESSGDCTIFGSSDTISMLDAALANGVMAHSTSQDDLIAGVAHPGSVVVPAAIAVAEQEGASGAEVLSAIVVGYDLVWRILRATGPLSNSAFRPGTIFTTFGAAAAAGKLMGLNEEQLTHALGYAASLTPGSPNEGWWGGTLEPMFEIGMTARIGILSALFAGHGATAAPSVLEGRHGFFRCWAGTLDNMAQATKDLGQSFAITRTYIKPFAACGANQVPMQVASTLASHGLKAGDIVRVVEKLRPGAADYAGLDYAGPFSSSIQALMSMQFCTAATILGRPVDTPWFIAEHYDDPEVAAVAATVELVCEEGRSVPGFEVYTRDGKMLVAEEQSPDRSIHTPTTATMQQKFRMLAANALGEATTEEVIGLVLSLDSLKDIRELTAKLRC